MAQLAESEMVALLLPPLRRKAGRRPPRYGSAQVETFPEARPLLVILEEMPRTTTEGRKVACIPKARQSKRKSRKDKRRLTLKVLQRMSLMALLGIISKYFPESVSTASKALMRDLDGGHRLIDAQ